VGTGHEDEIVTIDLAESDDPHLSVRAQPGRRRETHLGTHHKHPSDNRAQRLRYDPCALGVDSPVAQQPAAW
jgi:hypothetical protein